MATVHVATGDATVSIDNVEFVDDYHHLYLYLRDVDRNNLYAIPHHLVRSVKWERYK